VQKTTELSHLLGFLGLCRRAGKMVLGTPLVCEELAKRKKPDLVLYSSDASEATRKRIENKCRFYGTEAIPLPVSTGDLAHALGKRGDLAALAVTDAGFGRAIRDKLTALSTPCDEGTISTGKDASNGGGNGDKI
jgi:ribosomal protein L7Ae-like RNA K-turn-binding protein